MKNILKKLGVLGLIIAVLAPFMELPKVNAAESNCTKHLQNYMFLDVNSFPTGTATKTFLEGYSSEETSGGYLTYTVFPYAFVDNSSVTTKVNWIEQNNFGGGTGSVSQLSNFWKMATKENDTSKKYVEVESSSYYADNVNIGSVFINDTSHTGSTYVDDAIIFHGVWSNFNANGEKIYEGSWGINSDETAYSIQKVFEKKEQLDLMSSTIDTAFLNTGNGSSKFKFGSSSYTLDASYFQAAVDGNWGGISVSSSYIPLSIKRTINYSTGVDTVLNKFIFGYVDDSAIKIFTKTGKTDVTKINDSYTAFKEYLADKTGTASTHIVTCTDCTEDSLDFNTNKAYYWPTVLTVEYETCSTSSVVGKWTVTYDDNVDDTSVTNLPDTQTESVGTNITVSSKKPSRSGYTFKNWCKNSNGSGSCYNSGDEIKYTEGETKVTLYAQWGESGATDNKKTGVVSYIIGFAAVGVVAGGIYLISKKKNLFKQI